jgi:hypothetical protein
MVDVGALMPGARAPSLRAISRERKVSMATAMQAIVGWRIAAC